MAVHAGLGRRQGGHARFLDRIVAIAAIHPQFAHVQGVAIGHRLRGRVAHIQRRRIGPVSQQQADVDRPRRQEQQRAQGQLVRPLGERQQGFGIHVSIERAGRETPIIPSSVGNMLMVLAGRVNLRSDRRILYGHKSGATRFCPPPIFPGSGPTGPISHNIQISYRFLPERLGPPRPWPGLFTVGWVEHGNPTAMVRYANRFKTFETRLQGLDSVRNPPFPCADHAAHGPRPRTLQFMNNPGSREFRKVACRRTR